MILTIQEVITINELLEEFNLRISISDACGGSALYFKKALNEEEKATVETVLLSRGYKVKWLPGNRYIEIE